MVAILGDLQYNTIRHGGRWRRRGSDPWGPTIRRGGRWRRRGSDPWGPTIQYNVGEGGGDVVAILGDLQYNTTWGKVEETW